MPLFEIPSPPTAFDRARQTLVISGNFTVPRAKFERLMESAELEYRTTHIATYEAVTFAACDAEAYGFVGLHPEPNIDEPEDAHGESPDPYVHYLLQVRTVAKARKKVDPRWAAVMDALVRLAPEHEASVSYFVEYDGTRILPMWSLPIALTDADIRGFSEISGVRLANRGSDFTELYSVILDKSDYSQSVQAHVTLSTTLANPLSEALARALEVLDLAVSYSSEGGEP